MCFIVINLQDIILLEHKSCIVRKTELIPRHVKTGRQLVVSCKRHTKYVHLHELTGNRFHTKTFLKNKFLEIRFRKMVVVVYYVPDDASI